MAIERYSASVRVRAPVGVGRAYAELLASAGSPVSILSIEASSASNVGGHVALTRSFAIGTGHATGIFTGIAHRTIATQPTGPSRVQIAWTATGAGSPTGYISNLREVVLPVATGQTRTLWDASVHGELVIEPNKSLLVMNHASGIQGGDIILNFTWAEGRR